VSSYSSTVPRKKEIKGKISVSILTLTNRKEREENSPCSVGVKVYNGSVLNCARVNKERKKRKKRR